MENYPILVLDKRFLCTPGWGYGNQRLSYFRDLFIGREEHKMFSYPLLALRNIYVQDWVPGKSIKLIKDVINNKVMHQKMTRLKYYQNKQGKYIYPYAKDEYHYIKYEGRSDSWNKKMIEKNKMRLKREQQYVIKEHIQ